MAYRFVEPRTRVGDGITNYGGAKLTFYDFGTTDAKVTYSDFALTTPNALTGGSVIADADGMFPDIFLDIQADAQLQSSTDVNIWGPISFYAPEDGITDLAASSVSVLDVAGDFTATDVEAALTEISDGFAKLARINTFTANQTFSAASLLMGDNVIERPEIKDFSLTHNVLTQASATITVDLSTGNSFYCLLTENATIAFTNPPPTGKLGQLVIRLQQDSGGGAYTVTWPEGDGTTTALAHWGGGNKPVASTGNSAIDKFTMTTDDEGLNYYGEFAQAYAAA